MDEIRRAIAHAAIAGGLRYWARKEKRAAPGLLRAAALHSAKATEALEGAGGSRRGLSDPPATRAGRLLGRERGA